MGCQYEWSDVDSCQAGAALDFDVSEPQLGQYRRDDVDFGGELQANAVGSVAEEK